MNAIGWALPGGLVAGLVAWQLAGGSSGTLDRLDAVHGELIKFRPPIISRLDAAPTSADLITTPLFALTTGPAALREPSIRLDGLSMSRRRFAALISIDGKPSGWLLAGETRDGVTLQEVTSNSASFDTALGSKTLNLGEQSASTAPDPHGSAGQAGPTPTAAEPIPPHFHRPPEPANAPARR